MLCPLEFFSFYFFLFILPSIRAPPHKPLLNNNKKNMKMKKNVYEIFFNIKFFLFSPIFFRTRMEREELKICRLFPLKFIFFSLLLSFSSLSFFSYIFFIFHLLQACKSFQWNVPLLHRRPPFKYPYEKKSRSISTSTSVQFSVDKKIHIIKYL